MIGKSFFLEKLFVEQPYKYLTIAKNSFAAQIAGATVELHSDSTFYTETDGKPSAKHQIYDTNFDDTIWFPQALIISLTIVCCILSFSLGLLVRYNHFQQKLFLNKIDKANRMIFVIDNSSTCFKESVVVQNENWADNKYYP